MEESTAILSRLFAGEPSAADLEALVRRLTAFASDAIVKLLEERSAPFVRSELETQIRADVVSIVTTKARDTDADVRRELISVLPITHPELVLPAGFDEVRYAAPEILDPTLSDSVAGLREEWYQEMDRGGAGLGIILTGRTQYRSRDGVWHDIAGIYDRLMPPQEEPGEGEQRKREEWFLLFQENWTRLLSQQAAAPDAAVVLPSLILPTLEDSPLHVASRSLLHEIAAAQLSLHAVHWRQLEELVAELLRDMGLSVTVTPRTGDGGRDVIARGELIPGEPTVLAVEVKHRDVVPVSELRAALWANRNFPALLFVTSGRFSAGVYRERVVDANRLRLFLKDGVALHQWIDRYSRRHALRS